VEAQFLHALEKKYDEISMYSENQKLSKIKIIYCCGSKIPACPKKNLFTIKFPCIQKTKKYPK
jgi:hypothetical protein